MINDIICFSNDGFTCKRCKEKFLPGSLQNIFRWDNKMTTYCMDCLSMLDIDGNNRTIIWQANQIKDPRMKEK